VSRNLVLPQFPIAPQEYDAAHMAEIIRAFSVFLQQFNNPGDWRATELTLTNLAESDFGLEVGAVFKDGTVLRITTPDNAFPPGVLTTTVVGAVSTTIS
jgi:hypothetical protein